MGRESTSCQRIIVVLPINPFGLNISPFPNNNYLYTNKTIIIDTKVVGFPLDLIKTRMQTSGAAHVGIFSTGMQVLRTEGVAAMYKGVGPPLISLTILNMTTFTSYSYFHNRLGADRGWDWRNAVAGGICGPISSPVSTIENVVKTQMQIDNVTNKRFHGSFDFVKTIVREKGFLSLYTGHGKDAYFRFYTVPSLHLLTHYS
jgi:hypothetical protein